MAKKATQTAPKIADSYSAIPSADATPLELEPIGAPQVARALTGGPPPDTLTAFLWWLRERCNDEEPIPAEIQDWVCWKIYAYDGTHPQQQPTLDPGLDSEVAYYLLGFEQSCYDVQSGWLNLNDGPANFNASARADLKRIAADRQGSGMVLPNSNLEKFLWWLRERANAQPSLGISGLEYWLRSKIDAYSGTGPGSQPTWNPQLSSQVVLYLVAFEQACYYAQGGWANLNGNPADFTPPAEAQVKRVVDRCPPPINFDGV